MRKKSVRTILSIVLTVLLIAGGLLVVFLLDPLGCRIASGTSIGALDVGGMTVFQAEKALKEAAGRTVLSHTVTVELPESTISLDPKEIGLQLSTWKAVADAYRMGRKEGWEPGRLRLSQYLEFEEDAVRQQLDSYAARYNTTLSQPQWKVRGQLPTLGTDAYQPDSAGQTVELTMGVPERKLKVEDTMQRILELYDQGLEQVYCMKLDVPADKLPDMPDLQKIYDTCAVKPVSDSLNMETYELVHGSYGYHFDMEAAQTLVSQAEYGAEISIPMLAVPPEIYGDGVYFRDVLGECDTKHTDDENRNTNLRLLCQFLDGLVIQPGETFSYNESVGERSPERGFKPATVFSGNRIAKDYGGGVCQGSTTLYNCILEADLEVLERHGHGARVTYVPLGLDAAVNWLTKTDLQFRNTSHFPIMIRAEVSGGYLRMKLLGTDEKDYYIEMEAKSSSDGDYYYAWSYKCKYDKKSGELISRDRLAYSTYVAQLEG